MDVAAANADLSTAGYSRHENVVVMCVSSYSIRLRHSILRLPNGETYVVVLQFTPNEARASAEAVSCAVTSSIRGFLKP